MLRNTQEHNNGLFIFSNISLGLWNISDLLTALSSQTWAIWIDRASYVFALFVLPSFFLLIMNVSANSVKSKTPKVLIIGLVFFVLISPTSLLIKEVRTTPSFEEIPGTLYPLFVLFFLSWLCYGLVQMYKAFKMSHGFVRNQLKYFCLALLIVFLAAINYFLTIFFENVPPLYYLLVTLYSTIVAYAVIRFRLMDFDLIMRWGFAYGVLALSGLFIFIGISVTLETWLHLKMIPGSPTLASILLVVLLYDPLKQKINRFIDQFIFKSADIRIILSDIEHSLFFAANIPQLTKELADKFKAVWKVEHAGLLLWNHEKAEFDLFPQEEFSRYPIRRVTSPINLTDFLIKTLETERRLFQYGIIVEDEITALGNSASAGERITFWKIRRTMRWLGASICVPIMKKERLIGLLILGQKKSGGLYNREDKKILSHLSPMLAEKTSNLMLRTL